MYADTLLIVGTNATFDTYGYMRIYGDLIVTNGGFLNAPDGTTFFGGGSAHISGPGYVANMTLGGIGTTGSVRLDNGAEVRNGVDHDMTVDGKIVLDDARIYYYYAPFPYGTVHLNGSSAVLEGSGWFQMSLTDSIGGVIRPGGSNSAGLLTVTGAISNSVPGSGTIEIELGGTDTNDYDRLHLTAGSPVRGPGTFWAGGILDVTLINGFEPGEDTFDILDFVAITGTFDTVNLPGGPTYWITNDLYVTGEITYDPPPAGSMFVVR
jgi:hypothetical protein